MILPNGVKAEKRGNTYYATNETLLQFPDPVVMVRNFARIYLRNLTRVHTNNLGEVLGQEVVIKKFALAYAPSEGVIAPILSAPFTTNVSGAPITVADDDEDTPVYFENFFINYQNYPITSTDPNVTVLTGPPFNYEGYSPADQAYNYYSGNTDPGIPAESDMKDWDNDHPENNILYVYERSVPSAARRATRVIIKAERFDPNTIGTANPDSEGDKFYALDIVNTEGTIIPLLRNQTYTVHLLNIEAGAGEADITNASKATSATVSGDPHYQELDNISDGSSSIGVSFTEQFYVQPKEDFVMFRYIPTSAGDETYSAGAEGNELVTFQVGSLNKNTGVFTAVTPADAASQGILAFNVENGAYKVWIDKNGGDVVPYVRKNNAWVVASAAEIANSAIEKWGMIRYELNSSIVGADGFFNSERTQTIHVVGTYNTKEMSRNVVIVTSPRQTMKVQCLDKYVAEAIGEKETVRILIPQNLSRSVFPLDFVIEPNGYSLTPDGDTLPVDYGSSIDPDNSGPAFYFIKTITQDTYNGLPTTTTVETVNGNSTTVTWKYFDCKFKTTLAQNACTVFVQNHYFNNANASDEFYNYRQRLFTSLALSPNTYYRNADREFTFVMDAAHTGTRVWWDPTNALGASASADAAREAGLSTTNRVFPPVMRVTLNGFTPQYEDDGYGGLQPVTSGLTHESGNTYLYTVYPSTSGTVELALKITGAVGSTASVTLSTTNITENPGLYAEASLSGGTIQAATFTNLSFGTSPLPLGLNKTSTFNFTYGGPVEPVTVSFSGLTLDSTTVEGMTVTSNGNGSYTLTPINTNVTSYSFTVKSTTRFSAGTVTLAAESYETTSRTVNRPTSFTIPQNALYIRNATTGNPSNFTTGNNNTYVYLNNTTDYAYKARSNFSNAYLNNATMTVTISDFSLVDDDAAVYFIYRSGSNGNYRYYYAQSTLSELTEATASNRVTLHFRTRVTGVSLNKTTVYVAPGKTTTLVATVSPDDADDKSVTWNSSNTAVATVSNTGVVTVSPSATTGTTTTITVTTNDGGYTASCVVTVRRALFENTDFSGSVFYGNGWPATYTFSIPSDYDMPAGGIDVELSLTNLVPDDANITESGGKYYYHTTSTGNKTLSFKTADNRTAAVSVTLSHEDFEPDSGTSSSRSRLTIPANTFNMTTAPNNNNTDIYIYSNTTTLSASTLFASFRKNNNNRNNAEIQFNTGPGYPDYGQNVYLRYSRNNNYYYATTTAGNLYSGGTVAFSRTSW